MRTIKTLVLLIAVGSALHGSAVAAQDLHIPLPVDSIDFLLRSAPMRIRNLTGTRGQGDRTDRANLDFDDSTTFMAKLAPAPRGGEDAEDFNNEPRYEVAAYELQKLFLDEDELVVPPTALRAFPLEEYRALDSEVRATFRDASSVVVLLQLWVNFVTDENVWDEDRFEADTAYARNWANANLFTYLIRHNDSNTGNLLISSLGPNPRVFAVDNGFAFNSIDSARGTRWRYLQVERFPSATVERLRRLTEDDLHRALGVVAQWVIEDERLVPVTPTDNIDPRRGVRERDGVIQFGLTRDEIDDTWYRLQEFLSGIDSGRYQTF